MNPTRRTALPDRNSIEAEVVRFNARFLPGDSILYIPAPGSPPEWDRIYRPAVVEAGAAVVELAGRSRAVPIATVHTAPIETTHVRAPGSSVVWHLALAFVAGFSSAVLVALMAAPARAEEPVEIIVQCHRADAA